MGSADPWEPPPLPAFQWRENRNPSLTLTGGPDRVAIKKAPKDWKPQPLLGFGAKAHTEIEPLLWEGDNA